MVSRPPLPTINWPGLKWSRAQSNLTCWIFLGKTGKGKRATNEYLWATERRNVMLFPVLEARVQHAKHALDRAISDNLIELCQQYLTLLAEYRTELYKLPDTLGLKRWAGACLWEDVINMKKTVRGAIEQTTRERTDTEALLRPFHAVSSHEGVATF